MSLILQNGNVSLPSWAIAALVGAVMLVLGSFITKFTKHSEVTISGPVEIRVLQENQKRIESQIDDSKNEIKEMIVDNQKDTRQDFKNVYTSLENISREQYNQGWRISSLEKTRKDNGA